MAVKGGHPVALKGDPDGGANSWQNERGPTRGITRGPYGDQWHSRRTTHTAGAGPRASVTSCVSVHSGCWRAAPRLAASSRLAGSRHPGSVGELPANSTPQPSGNLSRRVLCTPFVDGGQVPHHRKSCNSKGSFIMPGAGGRRRAGGRTGREASVRETAGRTPPAPTPAPRGPMPRPAPSPRRDQRKSPRQPTDIFKQKGPRPCWHRTAGQRNTLGPAHAPAEGIYKHKENEGLPLLTRGRGRCRR